jgi:hypothetical protein
MKLIKAEVNWMLGWANHPKLDITVDKIPNHNDMVYQKKGSAPGNALYYSEQDGYVSFMCHNFTNERGYGGRTFNMKLEDGTTDKIKGPWSSRAGAMNHYFPHCVDVTLRDLEGHTYGASVSLKFAQKAAKMAGVKLVKTDWHDDIEYQIDNWKALKKEIQRQADELEASA